MTPSPPQTLVLSIYPFYRGFAFVLFEGPTSPFDWGVKRLTGGRKNDRILGQIKKLIDRYRPEALVIEGADPGWRRAPRIRRLYRMLVHLAATEFVDLHRCSRAEVRACFASVGASTKHEIAKAVAAEIPAFAHRLPRLRRAWMDKDSRQGLFDAAALALTYFARGVPSPYTDDLAA